MYRTFLLTVIAIAAVIVAIAMVAPETVVTARETVVMARDAVVVARKIVAQWIAKPPSMDEAQQVFNAPIQTLDCV